MKGLLLLGVMVLASATCDAAGAAEAAYSDVSVVSVVPRSPNLRPFVMSISTRAPSKQTAPLKVGGLDADR